METRPYPARVATGLRQRSEGTPLVSSGSISVAVLAFSLQMNTFEGAKRGFGGRFGGRLHEDPPPANAENGSNLGPRVDRVRAVWRRRQDRAMAQLMASESASGYGRQLEAVAARTTPAVSNIDGSLTPANRAWEASSPRCSDL